jgi:hypothetical protein
MTTRRFSFRRLALAGVTTLLLAAAPGRAHAQADLTFSGGQGMPLVLTLNAPVTYLVTTAAASGHAPFFDLQGLGNLFANPAVGITITFTINTGVAQMLYNINSGPMFGSVASTDAYLYGTFPGVAVGDTVVLSAGTLTTSGNFAAAAPANGSYPTFLFDDNGIKLDAADGVSGGTAAPEPSTWALLLSSAGLLGLMLRRRRLCAA